MVDITYAQFPKDEKSDTTMNHWYTSKNLLWNLIGTNWRGPEFAFEHTLTFAGQVSDHRARECVKSYFKTLTRNGYEFHKEYVGVIHRQPGTGNLDYHITLVNVSNDLDLGTYRTIVSKHWKYGLCSFNPIRNIYGWITYQAEGMKPTSPNYAGKGIKKIFHTRDMKRTEPVVINPNNINPKDIIHTTYWPHGLGKTITLRPVSIVAANKESDQLNSGMSREEGLYMTWHCADSITKEVCNNGSMGTGDQWGVALDRIRSP